MRKSAVEKLTMFRTTDLALATVISLWFPLESVDKQNPRKAEFVFLTDPKLDALVKRYWQRELKVEAQAFFSALKFIKSRLYE
ncbi:MAG: DUF5659 domain-containing protein [Patescibacteria group bacterium]